MNRTLGDGTVSKITKRSAIIFSERLGQVSFPLSAASVVVECTDLREKFSPDELLIFTAKRIAEGTNFRYEATSVIKPRELINCVGRISEIHEKFCYANISGRGKAFIPYSARLHGSQPGKAWLGKGAEVNKYVELKIFRQPDINNCKYVAWSVSVGNTLTMARNPANIPSIAGQAAAASNMAKLPGTNGQLRGVERVIDVIKDQIGVIVILNNSPGSSECLIYSVNTGYSLVDFALRESWMELGRFVKYEAVKLPGDSHPKATYSARCLTDLGFIYQVTEDGLDDSKWYMHLPAVVNRVAHSTRNAWLWNDMIGRMYVTPAYFNKNLKAFQCVEARISYTGAFDDAPWLIESYQIVNDVDKTEKIREDVSQLLLTDDKWTMKHLNNTQSTYGFMDNPSYGPSFFAWTDVNDEEMPNRTGRCRATVFHQHRHGKHEWRVVLVTYLDENGEPVNPHPCFARSGKRVLPEPFVAPQSPIRPAIIAPPPGIPVLNHWTRQSESSTAPSLSSIPPVTRPSVGVIGSGIPNNHNDSSRSSSVPPPSPPASAADSPVARVASPADQPMDDNVFLSSDSNFFPICLNDDEINRWKPYQGNDGTIHSTSTTHSSTNQAATRQCDRAERLPQNEFMTPRIPDLAALFSSYTYASVSKPTENKSAVQLVDAETQTDVMVEQTIIRDVMLKREFRNLLAHTFPNHFSQLMDMNW